MEQILLTQINLEQLLDKIGAILDDKLSKVNSQKAVSKSDFLSRKQTADLLKITLPTLHEWTKLEWLKSYKIGNRVLYKLHEVLEAVKPTANNKHKKYTL